MVKGAPAAFGCGPKLHGMAFIETYLYDADTQRRAAAAAVGADALFASAPGKGILAHREANGVLHAYVALRKPESWLADLAGDGDMRGRVLAEFAE